jgi:glutathione S-transferase
MGLKEGVDYTIIDGAPGTPCRAVVEKTGGRSMVPFLVDGEVLMYESDDIIGYLRQIEKRNNL